MAEIQNIKDKINKKQIDMIWNDEFIEKLERETIEWLYKNQYEYEEEIPSIDFEEEYDDKIYKVYKFYLWEKNEGCSKYLCRVFTD